MSTQEDRIVTTSAEDFGDAELGDARRSRRLVQMAAGVLRRPGGTIASVYDTLAEQCAAYDFVENEAIDPCAMLRAACTSG